MALACVLALISLGGVHTCTAAEKPFIVVCIDTARVLALHPDMTKVTKQLQTRLDALQKEMQEKAKGLDEEAKKKLLAEYQTKLNTERQTQQTAVVKKINAAIQAMAKKKGYSLVLDSRAVLYGGRDITDEFLKSVGVKLPK